MPVHIIANKYDEMKNLFSASPLDPAVTTKFQEINDLCSVEINQMARVPIKCCHRCLLFPVCQESNHPIQNGLNLSGSAPSLK